MDTNKRDGDTIEGKLNITPDSDLLNELQDEIVLIKYGGNAMVEELARERVFSQIKSLNKLKVNLVVVHGGGPYIKTLLDDVGLKSTFIGGHRKTDKEAMGYVEMALSGQVNGEIVKQLNSRGVKAVGLSGKDAGMVRASQREYKVEVDGKLKNIDLGHVGDVLSIETGLLKTLLENNYTPVLAPVGVGEDLKDFNINADMFAGHMAGALNAKAFVALTNVDGLMEDPGNPDTLFESITLDKVKAMIGNHIEGGMIPKAEACLVALEQGADSAYIINGMKSDTLLKALLTRKKSGTRIEL